MPEIKRISVETLALPRRLPCPWADLEACWENLGKRRRWLPTYRTPEKIFTAGNALRSFSWQAGCLNQYTSRLAFPIAPEYTDPLKSSISPHA